MNPSCIRESLVSIVDLVHSHELRNHQFYEFLSEIEAEYLALPYQFNLFELGAEIEIFLNENCPLLLLSNTE